MSRDKQIEEMARNITLFTERVIINRCGDAVGTKRSLFSEGEIAERLYNAGYRKSTEVAEEIFAEIDKVVIRKIIRDGEVVYDVTDEYNELKKKYTEEGK